jgi:hypothetical protein
MRVYTDRATLPDGTYIAQALQQDVMHFRYPEYLWIIEVENGEYRVRFYMQGDYIEFHKGDTMIFKVAQFLGGDSSVKFIPITLDEFIADNFEKLL